MITTIVFGLLALEAIALSASLGFCKAARQGDEDLAHRALLNGQPEIAALYRLGATA